MLKLISALLLALALISPSAPGGAVAVDKPLNDPALEARARALHKRLRCLVCQNQSIEDSNADLARDLRQVVRERLAKGASDDQVLAYMVARYGDWVLLQPPVKPSTWLLWSGPALLLLIGATVVFLRRRRSAGAAAELSADERRRLDRLLDKGPDV